jgi:hypothetical protein
MAKHHMVIKYLKPSTYYAKVIPFLNVVGTF